MNCKFLLASVVTLLVLVSTPAMSMDSKSCQAQSAQMQSAERDGFMKKCLAQLSDPANVKDRQQQGKRARCEQNAKNQNLQGSAQANFVASCMSKNEAAEAAKANPTQAEPKAAPAAKPKKASATGKPGNSCLKQAKQKGLKGDERKQFLKECKAG